MLVSLYIKNFALIEELNVGFNEGFTIITGETGAGKSILLGGLSLVLGKRADLSQLKNKEEKCVIEAQFQIENYNLETFFKNEDLDYEKLTYIRREILPSGKSRAFINDTPVTLDVLQNLGGFLLDIHSQHQTLDLANNEFQFNTVDAIAKTASELQTYKQQVKTLRAAEKQLKSLKDEQEAAAKDYEYNSFLLKELKAIPLATLDKELLESDYEQLSNVEEIKEKLAYTLQLINAEEIGLQPQTVELKNVLNKLQAYGKTYAGLHDRIQSILIEIDDISAEVSELEEGLESDPQALDKLQQTLQSLYNLETKHAVSGVEELVAIQNEIERKVGVTENADEAIQEQEEKCSKLSKQAFHTANTIHKKRSKAIPVIEKQINETIAHLGMPNAKFKVVLDTLTTLQPNGIDSIDFELAANKGSDFGPLKKVASGGELSRIMLAVKGMIAAYMHLPTIMFDEIDTGVSGEIAAKMADVMKELSKYSQVFCITHLPQVAAKGKTHYKVFKEDTLLGTNSNLKKLSKDERIEEIAMMLSGSSKSESAIIHAKELLN